jgi:small-conductance mechanosensitive channel
LQARPIVTLRQPRNVGRKIRAESAIRQEEAAKAHKKQLIKNERRVAELDLLFQRVYEDYATAKLSDERYQQLSGSYEKEQAELKAQNAALQAELDAFNADGEKAGRFIEIVRRYTEFDELTTPMLNEFIHKILVHEADKSSGERVQKVEIYRASRSATCTKQAARGHYGNLALASR